MKYKRQILEEKYGSRVSPRGFFLYSKIYHDSFEELDKASKNMVRFYPATYFLSSRSIELSLKSVLRQKGYTLDVLSSKKFGHNLDSLVKEVVDKKYIPITNKEISIIKHTNFWYKSKQYEYQLTGSKDLPSSEDLSFVCVSLLSKLDKFLA